MLSLILQKKDGTRYKLNDIGIRVVEFEPESLDVMNDVITIPGRGVVVNNLGYGARYINASFRIFNRNLMDYADFRSDIFNVFTQEDSFYLYDEKEIYKRWHVRSDGNFSLDRAIKTGNFDVRFICVNRYAESVYSSLQLSNRKEWDVGLWAWNGMIDWDSETTYSFNSNSFVVHNGGNAKVMPEDGVLTIRFRCITSGVLEIKNATTNEKFRYNAPLNANDTVVIRGIRVTKNNVNAIRDTNFEFISLNPGRNEIVVTGGTIQNIEFDFKYLFK